MVRNITKRKRIVSCLAIVLDWRASCTYFLCAVRKLLGQRQDIKPVLAATPLRMAFIADHWMSEHQQRRRQTFTIKELAWGGRPQWSGGCSPSDAMVNKRPGTYYTLKKIDRGVSEGALSSKTCWWLQQQQQQQQSSSKIQKFFFLLCSFFQEAVFVESDGGPHTWWLELDGCGSSLLQQHTMHVVCRYIRNFSTSSN